MNYIEARKQQAQFADDLAEFLKWLGPEKAERVLEGFVENGIFRRLYSSPSCAATDLDD